MDQSLVSPSRLIPAHAGKTNSVLCGHNRPRAHPRACGENPWNIFSQYINEGSSPRMRGKLWHALFLFARFGLIPAHAGKTQRWNEPTYCYWAHPRACGENTFPREDGGADGGSSPRMRGKPPRFQLTAHAVRLIPAHAGKTMARAKNSGLARAHPRACGENVKQGD